MTQVTDRNPEDAASHIASVRLVSVHLSLIGTLKEGAGATFLMSEIRKNGKECINYRAA